MAVEINHFNSGWGCISIKESLCNHYENTTSSEVIIYIVFEDVSHYKKHFTDTFEKTTNTKKISIVVGIEFPDKYYFINTIVTHLERETLYIILTILNCKKSNKQFQIHNLILSTCIVYDDNKQDYKINIIM